MSFLKCPVSSSSWVLGRQPQLCELCEEQDVLSLPLVSGENPPWLCVRPTACAVPHRQSLPQCSL